MVTPLNESTIREVPLFNEPFEIYTRDTSIGNELTIEQLPTEGLMLLEEGHCFRSQILKFCELSKMQHNNVEYSSGSLETLKNLTDRHLGITILPEMATLNFSEQDKAKIKHFASPQPIRKVSLLTHRDYIKKRLVSILIEEIKNNLPAEANNPSENVVGFKLRE